MQLFLFLFPLLFLAEFLTAICLLVFSPKKLQTLGRMVLVFVIVVLLITVPAALFRQSNPQAWGALAGAIAPFVAVLVGWLNVRSLRRSASAAAPVGPSS